MIYILNGQRCENKASKKFDFILAAQLRDKMYELWKKLKKK